MTIAHTILAQLGGKRFAAMTGARGFTDGGDFLSFRIPQAKGGVNYVKVVLDEGRDLYRMEFGRIRAHAFDKLAVHSDLYWDQLAEVFERETGLYTKL